MADTLVFIPAWNEAENLPAVLAEVRGELPDVDVLLVDDGSTDATARVARAGGAEVVSFGENRGLRAAVAAGSRYALNGGYELCGRVDADGGGAADRAGRAAAHARGGGSERGGSSSRA